MYIGTVHGTFMYVMCGALLDFDGADPGTTNEESENLRKLTRSPISIDR